ncbi:MAG: hypothetical protein H6R14_2814 [Proteobacteria bacterium]|nr:hypothetical protein [Pseudomonadota bacterium]
MAGCRDRRKQPLRRVGKTTSDASGHLHSLPKRDGTAIRTMALLLRDAGFGPTPCLSAIMRKPTLYQSIKAKRRTQSMVIGLTWYTPETWAQVKARAVDPACFEESFDKWKAMAVAARRNFQRSGVMALEYQIVPEEFFAWCAKNGQANDSTARGEYVSERLSAVHGGEE